MGLAFLITTDRLQLLSERRVMKEAEYAALLDASQVVEAARAEAQRIVAQADAEAEHRRRLGHEQGLAEAKREHAQRLIGDAVAAERQLRALRSAMAGLVVKAVGQFIAEADPQHLFQAALTRVDGLLRSEAFISVRVATGQEAMLRQALSRMHAEAPWTAQVTVQPDATLAEGACVVHTASGTLEIGVDAQLEAFRRAVQQSGVGGLMR